MALKIANRTGMTLLTVLKVYRTAPVRHSG
jgi:hypothetical protein